MTQRPYQLLPAWMGVCERSLGVEFGRHVLRLGEREVGELSFALLKSRLFGRRLISMPFSDGSGLLPYPGQASSRELLESLARFLDSQAADHALDYAELRGELPADGGAEGLFSRQTPYVRFVLDLSVGYPRVRAGYSRNIRENLRKAQGRVEVEYCRPTAMPDDLYATYLAQMRRFGSPPLPKAYFSGLLACGLARLYVARVKRRAVAFLLALVHGGAMLAEINASLERFDGLFPKVRLFDGAIAAACSEGLGQFDFMRTRPGSGVYWHKRKWGGAERPIHYYFRSRRPALRVLDPSQRRFLLPQLAFRCMPAALSARLGPRLRALIGK